MKAKRLVSLLAFSAALGSFAACGGSPATPGSLAAPGTPAPPVTFTFSGTVKSGGAGLGNADVALSGDARKNTRTDGQGAFSFSGVSGNRFVIVPTLANYSFDPPKYELGPTSRTDLDFMAAKAGDLQVGDTARDFTAVDQNGQTVSLYSYRGQVVFIDFSTDWCGFCRVEAPMLEALYQEYKGQGFQALTILVEGSATAWASTFNVTHPVLQDYSRAISGPYRLQAYPLNVILDRNMIIRYKENDDFDRPRILAVLKEYL